MPTEYERQQQDAAKRKIEQTRKDMEVLREKIRASKETIARADFAGFESRGIP